MTTKERIKTLVHEGNVRHVVVTREGKTVAQFPLTFGVVGAVIAPAVAVGAGLVALATGSSVGIERTDTPEVTTDEPSAEIPAEA
jgi:hypothetical protein